MNKIAIPTNDRLSVARQTGRASEFAIFTLNAEGKPENTEYRINSHNHDHDHDHDHEHEQGHNHDDLAALLSDCNRVVVQHAGPHFKGSMDKAAITIVFTSAQTIEEAINEIANSNL